MRPPGSTMDKLQKLYGKTSTGSIKSWEVEVTDNGDDTATLTISTMANIELDDGKVTKRATIIKNGKNIGKTNETSALEQAEKEALAKWTNKQDIEEYQLSAKVALAFQSERPMLAYPYEDKKHLVNWERGVYGQAKLNGVRCTIKKIDEGNITFTSRKGKDYTPVMQRHTALYEQLDAVMTTGSGLDGELYVPGWELNKVTSAVKKYKANTEKLQFYLFDFINSFETFSTRYGVCIGVIQVLATYLEINNGTPFINLVECKILHSEEEMITYHDELVKEGHEGIILRNPDALYTYFYRTSDLLKYKKFFDEEFEIVDTYCETQNVNGVEKNLICFWCITKDNERFKVQPKGTHEMRAKWWEDRESFIGKQLTVRYQEWSGTEGGARNTPVFGKGICVRDYE